MYRDDLDFYFICFPYLYFSADNNSRERNNTHQQAISALVDELRRETKAAEKEKRLRERFRLRRAAPLGSSLLS